MTLPTASRNGPTSCDWKKRLAGSHSTTALEEIMKNFKKHLSRRARSTAVPSVLAFAVTALAAVTAPAIAQDVHKFRVATIEATGTPMNDAFVQYIDRLNTCSNGRLVGQNFPDGQLGGFIDLIDGNRQGTYEVTMGGFDVRHESTTMATQAAIKSDFTL